MGYRTYIGYIPKTEYNKIKLLTHEKLCKHYKRNKMDDFVDSFEITKELYEFGKYTEFDNKKFFKPFFKNKKLQEYYEGDFWIVEKEFLKHIIEHYKGKIIAYYDKLLDCSTTDRTHEKHGVLRIKEEELKNIAPEKFAEWFRHIIDMRMEWTHDFAFNMKEDSDKVTHSWKYEYSIFELVRIYKTFDWKNNSMVYYGY